MRLARLFSILALIFAPAVTNAMSPISWGDIAGANSLIGKPVELGATGTAATSNSQLTTTTIAKAPTGTLIVWFAGTGTDGARIMQLAAGTDSVSNSYTGISGGGGSSGIGSARGVFAANVAVLPSGDAFTGTYFPSGVNSDAEQIGYSVSGIAQSNPADAFGAGSSPFAGNRNPSASESTPAQNNRIVLGFVLVVGGASDTFVESSGWTTAPGSPIVTGASPNNALHVAYQIVNTSGALTYNPSLGTSRQWVAGVQSFDGQ